MIAVTIPVAYGNPAAWHSQETDYLNEEDHLFSSYLTMNSRTTFQVSRKNVKLHKNTYSEPTLLNQNILIKYRMYYRKSGRQIDPPTFTSEDENTYCCVAKGSNLISGRADRSVFLALYLGKCLGQLKANKALYKPIILISQA